MSNKLVYSIYIDAEVREKARDYGLNISKITENTLRFLLQRMDDYTSVIEEKASIDSQKSAKEVQQ